MQLIMFWVASAPLSLVIYLAAALLVDGRVDPGTWEKHWLTLMLLLGPLGTLLVAYLVVTELWVLRCAEWQFLASCRSLRLRLARRARVQLRRLVLRYGGRLQYQP